MSDAARMKRLGIDHLSCQEQTEHLAEAVAQTRQKEEAARQSWETHKAQATARGIDQVTAWKEWLAKRL